MTLYFKMKKVNCDLESVKALNSTVSHEMRAPLRTVLQLTSIVMDKTSDYYTRKLLQTIFSSAKILYCRLSDFLDSQTMEKKVFFSNKAPFNLKVSLSEILHILNYQATL